MTTLSKILLFSTGAAIGSLVTWKFVKTKYEQMAQEKIEFVIERFEKKYGADSEDKVLPGSNEKPSLSEYESMLADLAYKKEQHMKVKNASKEAEEDEEDMTDKPYVITPDEFDEHEDYEVETLTLYADGVLTDWYDEPIDDVDEYVGKESLTRFGEYEKDTVYVRNEAHKTDYEIQRDTRNYEDVHSHQKED